MKLKRKTGTFRVAPFKIMEMETVKAERPGITKLKSWLNKNMKVLMSDGRVLVGIFLCTDKYAVVEIKHVFQILIFQGWKCDYREL